MNTKNIPQVHSSQSKHFSRITPDPRKRSYLIDIIHGMFLSIKHAFRPRFTIQYPEVTKELAPRVRGEHRLKIDDEGHIKCVACYMCSTACPAQCIHIVAGEAPEEWEGREKIPVRFEIDELRCIFCGYCVEACPKDAIEMTTRIPRVYTKREDFIYDLNKLVGNEGASSTFALTPLPSKTKVETKALSS